MSLLLGEAQPTAARWTTCAGKLTGRSEGKGKGKTRRQQSLVSLLLEAQMLTTTTKPISILAAGAPEIRRPPRGFYPFVQARSAPVRKL